MNPSSSNSLLKFIEEPEEGIYGILITTDRSKLLPTILSRCNLISLKSSKKINLRCLLDKWRCETGIWDIA